MRLNAYLARSGVASRRRADELIRDGRVRVNGEPGELNTVVGRHDVVEVDGARVERQRLAYVLLNKPSGVVTTASDPQGRRTVVDLVPLEPRVVPVGRLDIDTTGALLLTNDGDLAHRLAHPRYGVPKIYEVDVAGSPSADVVARLRDGVELDDGPTAPARVRVLGRGPHWTRLELTLHEGRNRQVKRMCEAVGHPVRRLRRTRYSALDVDGLAIGEWRELTAGEVAALRPQSVSSQADEAHPLVHRVERRLRRRARLLGPEREQSPQLARIVARSSRKRSLDRLEEGDDGFAGVVLELAVAGCRRSAPGSPAIDSPVATVMISMRFEMPGLSGVVEDLALRSP